MFGVCPLKQRAGRIPYQGECTHEQFSHPGSSLSTSLTDVSFLVYLAFRGKSDCPALPVLPVTALNAMQCRYPNENDLKPTYPSRHDRDNRYDAPALAPVGEVLSRTLPTLAAEETGVARCNLSATALQSNCHSVVDFGALLGVAATSECAAMQHLTPGVAPRRRRRRRAPAAPCYSTVTIDPSVMYGHTIDAAVNGSSTHPRLCGSP